MTPAWKRITTTMIAIALGVCLASSTCFGEEIDIDWATYKGQYFYSLTRLPEGAKVKLTVIDLREETQIIYVVPNNGDLAPKQNALYASRKGDRFSFKIGSQGDVSIRAGAVKKAEGNMLYYDGLTLKVVCED
jgi:hypothetical protein